MEELVQLLWLTCTRHFERTCLVLRSDMFADFREQSNVAIGQVHLNLCAQLRSATGDCPSRMRHEIYWTDYLVLKNSMNRRLAALVIGNANYRDAGTLKNPTNDAEDVGARLQAFGFSVIVETDCTIKEMDQALKKFKKSLEDNDIGLFFFAGHGMQIEGDNYLAAVDTDISGEVEIIKYIAEGLSNKQIADKLNLSTHTVNTHRKNIMSKLGVNNTAGVVMFAVKNQLLETNFSLFDN